MERLVMDLRYGVRMLVKKPLFTAIAILSLALCIGANTAVFSIINAVLLRPYPNVDADSWVYVWEKPEIEGVNQVSASIANYKDWKEQNQSFSSMVMWTGYTYSLSGSDIGEPELVNSAIVSTDLFSGLNLTPAAGSMVFPSPKDIGNDYMAIISYGLWQRRFGGDPHLIGKKITLNLVPQIVIGVAPPDFSFPPEGKIDIWTPYPQRAIDAATDHSARGFRVAAKLKPGITVKQAQSNMDLITAHMAQQYPDDKGYGVTLVPMREQVAGSFRTPLFVLAGALAFVLLLTCTNIANLQLVRLEARRGELAIRTALGASQGLLIRQILLESLMLVFAGGLLGMVFAPTGAGLLLSMIPRETVTWLSVKTDPMVVLVSIGITLLTAIISALVPAIKASRISLSGIITSGKGSSGNAAINNVLRSAFLVAQLALAVIPLTGAGLFISSLRNLENVDPGFQVDHRLTMSIYAPRARYNSAEKVAQLIERVADETRHIPGVKDAGITQYLPFSAGAQWLQAITRTNPKEIENLTDLPHVRFNIISTGFLDTMNVPLKSGRFFTQADNKDGAPVAIINEAVAKKFFPNEDPIGKSIWTGHAQLLPQLPARTIIGIVGDTVRNNLEESPMAAVWIPATQQTYSEDIWRMNYLAVHTTGDPSRVLSAVKDRVSKIDSDLAMADIVTMDNRMSQSLWRQRLPADTMAFLGLIALVIAMLGVFGVTSYLVTQRKHEIGVRIALGAQRSDIFRLIIGQGLILILIGAAIGVVGSLFLTRLVASLLYGIGAKDPFTLVGATALLVVVGVMACYFPARRATRVDPMVSLRTE